MAFLTDVTIEAIVKIVIYNDDNVNSVPLNLDKSRHFVPIKDKKRLNLKNRLIKCYGIYQSRRVEFFKSISITFYGN
jgi:hypothetical protein